jgi:4'-phosphopantetheinyl transferase
MDPLTKWTPAPEFLKLAPDSVHLWLVSLDLPESALPPVAALLNSEESSRAARFVNLSDQHRFTVARAVLRFLLARYLFCSPSAVLLEAGEFGKPVLAADGRELPLHFNLAHSHGRALYAFALSHELGVDIEWLRPKIACEEIATRYFSTRERKELLALPPALRVEGFFNAWTRKESYIKAHGKGLQIPLESFDVTLTPGHPVSLHSSDTDRWRIYSFTPAENFAAALTVEAGGAILNFYEADSLVKQLAGWSWERPGS